MKRRMLSLLMVAVMVGGAPVWAQDSAQAETRMRSGTVAVDAPIFPFPDAAQPQHIAKAGSRLIVVERTADWYSIEFLVLGLVIVYTSGANWGMVASVLGREVLHR
jgi:hypothetical protein